MHMKIRSGFLSVAGMVVAFALSLSAARSQSTYSTQISSSYYGYMDQYSLPVVGSEACVPTSTTNAFIYLQNRYSSLFGTTLAGATYAEWTSTDETLASDTYYGTSSLSGTLLNLIPSVVQNYLTARGAISNVVLSGLFPADYWNPPTKPSFITDGQCTWNFLYNNLSLGAALIFGIEYSGGGGHELLATGFSWYDANGDGIIQWAEDASLTFLDPLDPSQSYGTNGDTVEGGAKFTSGHLWEAGGELKLDYNQYQGDLPHTNDYATTGTTTIHEVMAIQAIPEPSSIGFVLMGLTLLCLMRQRRVALICQTTPRAHARVR